MFVFFLRVKNVTKTSQFYHGSVGSPGCTLPVCLGRGEPSLYCAVVVSFLNFGYCAGYQLFIMTIACFLRTFARKSLTLIAFFINVSESAYSD